MLTLGQQLDLGRCPHCGINSPNVYLNNKMQVAGRTVTKHWGIYICQRCAGVITVEAKSPNAQITAIYPSVEDIDASIPQRAKSYLSQAGESLHAPAGAIMLAASAVDAMLKEKKYSQGNLYGRIEQAAKDGLITSDMAAWAHQVRLDANEQRHADENATEPTETDARRSLEFAMALAQFLFVLPARVIRGLKDAGGPTSA